MVHLSSKLGGGKRVRLLPIAFVIPEIGARDALAAMEECPLDDDDHREIGHATIVDHGAAQTMIADDQGAADHAKRLAPPGNKEDQADTWILQHVAKSVDAAVAAAIRDRKGRVIENSYESRAISLGGEIDHAERIGRAKHNEGRCRDKLPATTIEPV